MAASIWSVPAGRMKMRRAHRVPLAPQAIAMLRNLHATTGRGKLLFPSARSGTRPISDGTLNAALRRMGYGSDEMTSHGFRATASTLLNESGKWLSDSIERQLANQDADSIRRVYARGEFWPKRNLMMEWWAGHLDTLRVGVEIVPFEARPLSRAGIARSRLSKPHKADLLAGPGHARRGSRNAYQDGAAPPRRPSAARSYLSEKAGT